MFVPKHFAAESQVDAAKWRLVVGSEGANGPAGGT